MVCVLLWDSCRVCAGKVHLTTIICEFRSFCQNILQHKPQKPFYTEGGGQGCPGLVTNTHIYTHCLQCVCVCQQHSNDGWKRRHGTEGRSIAATTAGVFLSQHLSAGCHLVVASMIWRSLTAACSAALYISQLDFCQLSWGTEHLEYVPLDLWNCGLLRFLAVSISISFYQTKNV